MSTAMRAGPIGTALNLFSTWHVATVRHVMHDPLPTC